MQLEITVSIRSVYGKDMIYPVCEKAKLFVALTNSRTLSLHDIATIKALGYVVNVEQVQAVTTL